VGADAPGGAGGVAAAVVSLHGLGRSPSDWAAVGPGLEAFGTVRCPALDRDAAGAMAAARAATDDGAILVGHSLGAVIALRVAAEPGRSVRGVVLSGCFFPPARNGRSVPASVADYGRHRVAFVREARRRPRAAASRRGTAGALRPLLGMAARPARFDAIAGAVRVPVLVVHARDDHHVPVDFALAAAARHPGWSLKRLQSGGHHAHRTHPAAWLAAVAPWLEAVSRAAGGAAPSSPR